MSRLPLPALRRAHSGRAVLGRSAATVLLALGLSVTTVAPAGAAGNPVTPGNLTGYAFDQCRTPSQAAMDAWMDSSPFLAVGIYISGASRGCRDQPNLTPEWVSTQLARGWRLLPITLGPQASCHPGFPRYGNDPTIDPRPGSAGRYPKAHQQGRAEAENAVQAATALGIVPGSTLWYDLEGFPTSQTHCRESALHFLSAWTATLHRLDYVSGVYSSAGSGLRVLDDARVERPTRFVFPDRIWIARWDGIADTSTTYLRPDGWLPGNRMKQFQGGHDEVWGGVRINIDRSYVDLGRGSVARRETHCDGTTVDFTSYEALLPGVAHPAGQVSALKCLLSERGLYRGRVSDTYGRAVRRALSAWRVDHGQIASDTWSRRSWMTLLAAGPTPVVKFGSAGRAVRRVQRSLNAASRPGLTVTGVFDAATDAALRDWQRAVGLDVTGVASADDWAALQTGAR